jgi:hypothetical protein
MAFKLTVVRKIERSGPTQPPVFTVHCWLDVTPPERQLIKDYHDGWQAGYETSDNPEDKGIYLLPLLDDPGPTKQFQNLHDAKIFEAAINRACRDLYNYLQDVGEYEGNDEILIP